jgi:hypothetical protein
MDLRSPGLDDSEDPPVLTLRRLMKPEGCFRRPGIAAIGIVKERVGCLRRLAVLVSVSCGPHYEVERLGHPGIPGL